MLPAPVLDEKADIRPAVAPARFAPYPLWLMCREEISFGAKTTYAVLAHHAGKNDRTWPKMTTIAQELGTNERQVRRYVEELVAHRVVRVVSRQVHGRSNLYFFKDHEWIGEWEGAEAARKQERSDRTNRPVEGVRDRTNRPVTPDKSGRSELHHGTTPPEQELTHVGSEPSLRSSSFTTPTSQDQMVTAPENDQAQRAASWQNAPEDEETMNDERNNDGDARFARSSVTVAATARKTENTVLAQEERKRERRKQQAASGALPDPKVGPAIRRLEKLWRDENLARRPDAVVLPWGPKQGRMTKDMLKRATEEQIAWAMRFVVRYWDKIIARKSSKNSRPTGDPGFNFLVGCIDTMVLEAFQWKDTLPIWQEVEAWKKTCYSSADAMPGDLLQRYEAARKVLKKLGLD